MTNQGKNAIDVVLAESLKELSITRPIEKITIREITDKAGVIRPTFYNHFQDKYELLEWIAVNELFAPTEPLLAAGMLKEGMTFILTTIEKEKNFYQRAIQLEGQNSFNDIFKRCVTQAILKYLDLSSIQKVINYSWLDAQRIADFYSNAICYGVTEWIRLGMRVPVDEMVDAYLKVFENSIIEVFKKR